MYTLGELADTVSSATAERVQREHRDRAVPNGSDNSPTRLITAALRYRPTAVGLRTWALQELRPAWVVDFERRIERFTDLERGWNTYGAEPPNKEAISLARRVLKQLLGIGLRPTRVNPSADEGICISFTHGDFYADFECFNSGEIIGAVSGGQSSRVWEVGTNPHEIREAAKLIKEWFESHAA